MTAPLSPAAEAIPHDLRGRKLLKYLFAEDWESRGAYGYVDEPIELSVQHEIAEALATAAIEAVASDLLTEAQREFWAKRGVEPGA